MEKRKFRRNESGAVLLTVLCVMTIMIILVGASISFVNLTTDKTYKTFQSEQAYMTAQSCLESFVYEIDERTNATDDKAKQKEAIDQLEALADDNGGKGYEYDVQINGGTDIERMGSCTIKIARYEANSSIIVITATAKFGSETEQVAAYVQTDTLPRTASFSNAIEICKDNGGTLNNTHVLGDMSTITGNDVTKTYTLDNKFSTNGNLNIYGNLSTVSQAKITLHEAYNGDTPGCHIMVFGDNGDLYLANDVSVTTLLNKTEDNTFNYVNLSGTLKTANTNTSIGNLDKTGFDVDVYCTGTDLYNYKQRGNMYVYADCGHGSAEFKVNSSGKVHIYGDLYVEGTFNVATSAETEVTVHGDVYSTGTIPAKVQCEGGDTHKHPNSTFAKTGRAKRPEMYSTLNEYENYPEDFIANPDSTKGILKTQYNALANAYASGDTSKYFKKLFDDQQAVAAGSNYNGHKMVNDGSSKVVEITDSDGKVSRYAAVIDQSCIMTNEFKDGGNAVWNKFGGSAKVLIHVTNKDVVILLTNESQLQDASNMTFVVKNDSSSTAPHFCYFITYAGTSVDCNGETGRSKSLPVSFNLQQASIISYDIYGKLVKEGNGGLLAYKSSLKDSTKDPNFTLNLTGKTALGDYIPEQEKIIYLFTHGSKFYARQECMHEGIIYGPEAEYESGTQAGIAIPKVWVDSTADAPQTNVKIISLGMVICSSFNNQNESYYAFNEPDPNSCMGNAKKGRSDQLSGYKLKRFEHH